VLIIVGDPASGQERAAVATWAVVAAVVIPVLVACVLAARIYSGRPFAAVLLAVVAGSSLALFAVLTKGIVEVSEGGPGAVLGAPEFIPWLLLALTGMVFQQSAFRAGALTASMPTMTVAKPVVAGLLGILVLGESLNASGPRAFVLLTAVAVVIVATVALARGEAATMVAEAGTDGPLMPQLDVEVDASGAAVAAAGGTRWSSFRAY
jgi:hypothetical protein